MKISDHLLNRNKTSDFKSDDCISASQLNIAKKSPETVEINGIVEIKNNFSFEYDKKYTLVNRLNGGIYSLSELVPGNGCLA
jgi:hypothetical protein